MNKKIWVLIFALTLLVGCTTPQEKLSEGKESSLFELAQVKKIRIKSNTSEIKRGANKNSKSIDTLAKNDVADVIGRYQDWYLIKLPDSKNGAEQFGCVAVDDCQPIIKEGEKDIYDVPIDQSSSEEEITPESVADVEKSKETKEVVPAQNLTSDEQRMVTLVNQERRKNGLNSLTVDLELTKVARLKSKDLVNNDYFSHYSPTYGSPFDMMKTFEIEYVSAGENLAANSNVDSAHRALMNSEGHRQNILNPDFTHVGIGIVPSDKYGLMFTQMFINKSK